MEKPSTTNEPIAEPITTARRMFGLIDELNRDLGIGFVIVTHDLELAAHAQRVLAMRDGRLEPA